MYTRFIFASALCAVAVAVAACGGNVSTGDGHAPLGGAGSNGGGSGGSGQAGNSSSTGGDPAVGGAAGDGWATGGGPASGGAAGSAGTGTGGWAGGGQCKMDSDCPGLGMPCQVCADGTTACPSVSCVSGQCAYSTEACSGTGGAGGYAGSGGYAGTAGSAGGGGQCKSAYDCAVPDVCQVCANGGYSCATADCVNGYCTTYFPPCGGTYDPCAGLKCGDPCRVCDPNDPTCGSAGVITTCDAYGSCQAGTAACGNACNSNADCPMIGAPCQLCPDGSAACPSNDCIYGQCVVSWPTCGTPPPPPPAQCQSDTDCNMTGLCKDCGNGTCAQGACMNGSCQFYCPA